MPVVHRQRRYGHERDADVQERHRRGRAPHQALEPGAADPHLARQARGGLEARERDHRHGQREDQTRPGRRGAELDRVEQRVRVEEQRQPEHDDERLQRRSPTSSMPTRRMRRAAEAADVAEHDQRDERQRQAQRLAAIAERAPEDLQVLRRRVGRDGDQDHVVEQDRPAGDEADELVEGVAREHRRAAAILVQRGALDVGHGGHRVEQRRDQEHQRRQPQRVAGDHAQREVDRARQRGVDDREQDRRADAAPRHLPRARRQLRLLPPGRAHVPRLLRTSTYQRPPPAAMNSTPSSSRAETEPAPT